MKNAIQPVITNYHNNELEKLISKKDSDLKALARKQGKNFADRKLPSSSGDRLQPYIGEIKSGYEELCANLNSQLQPASHFPEVKTEVMNAEAEEHKTNEEIQKLEEQNRNSMYELENGNIEKGNNAIIMIFVVTALISLSEVFFNSLAFQAIGENTLVSLIIGLSLTIAILLLAHLTALFYKKIQNPIKRNLLVFGTLILVLSIFTVMGNMRAIAMEKLGTSVSSISFIVINSFFFIVTALLSYKYYPTKEERQKREAYNKLQKDIAQRQSEIKQHRNRMELIKSHVNEKAKQTLHQAYYVEYTLERINKLYKEAIQIFISTNMLYRTDRKAPDCFSDVIPELEINKDFYIYKPNNEEERQ